MSNLMKMEIVTPTGTVYTGDVVSCQVPGMEGSFQVLSGHTALLSAVRIGAVKIVDEKNSPQWMSITEGFCQVDEGKIIILTDTAEMADKIDVSRAEKARERALARIESPKKEDVDLKRAEAALVRALNRLKTAKFVNRK